MSIKEIRDYDELKAGAESGDVEAAYQLAELLGARIDENCEPEMQKWLSFAAENGHTKAMLSSYTRFLFTQTTDELGNKVSGFDKGGEHTRWIRKAAELGNIRAQGLLSSVLAMETHEDYDPKESLKWTIEYALQGYPEVFEGGIPELLEVLREIAESRAQERLTHWREQASEGDAEAMVQLAYLYESGSGGVEFDGEYATELYQQAAKKGHFEAELELYLRKVL